ncbi:MAG: hypothetical protein RLZZ360_554 [Candidatus Parcubacteria bacterium]|jgi:hypothetical protein
MITSYRSLTVLLVAVFALLAYNFLGAAWTPAPATPPNNNTAAPVDVSGVTQTKTGNIVANIFAATSQMRSNLYCNATGTNCINADNMINTINNISSTSSNPMANCRIEYRNVWDGDNTTPWRGFALNNNIGTRGGVFSGRTVGSLGDECDAGKGCGIEIRIVCT